MMTILLSKFPGRGFSLLLLLRPILASVSGDIINFLGRDSHRTTVGGVWPLPQKQVLQDQYVAVPDSFYFKNVDKSCDILQEAMRRYLLLLKTNWRDVTKLDLVNTSPSIVGDTTRLKIRLRNECEKYPHLNMDEKYTLEVKKGSSVLEADSIWGILRGLETFCQLLAPAFNGRQLLIQVQRIEDFPRFPHRGLLIDTSRHWLKLSTIKKQLDIMSYNKFNVLHWHIIDDQSFPYQSNKFPALSQKGSFDKDAVYTEETIKEIVEYARLRGIRVVPEFDTPGHSRSMDPGIPGLHCRWPDTSIKNDISAGPLDPTKNSTYEFMHDLLHEVHDRFPDGYIHLGGDEVSNNCWEHNRDIGRFMDERHWNASHLQGYYLQNIFDDVQKMNVRGIVWEEAFRRWKMYSNVTEMNATFGDDTIVQVWKSNWPGNSVKTIAQQGSKVITSCGWYLDYLEEDFAKFYQRDMSDIKLTIEESKFLLGGEACMWGEMVDDCNIEPRVWPRACAIAEHLWSAPHVKTEKDINRISEHVCRLRRRGVQAEPAYSASYCSDALPHPDFGSSGKFFSVNTWRDTLGLTSGDDEEDKPNLEENSSAEKSGIAPGKGKSLHENPGSKDSTHPDDKPVKDDKSSVSPVQADTGLLLLVWGLAVLVNHLNS